MGYELKEFINKGEDKMSKFKVGDKVRVIEDLMSVNEKSHAGVDGEMLEFQGLEFIVNECHSKSDCNGEITYYILEDSNGNILDYDYYDGNVEYFFDDYMLEKVEEEYKMEFTKSDLKNGMVVRTRENFRGEDLFLVVKCNLIARRGYNSLSSYEDNLTFSSDKDFDIIEVYECDLSSLDSVFDNLKSIWKREAYKEEEINLQKALELLGKGEEVIVCEKDIYCENVVKIIGSKHYFKNVNGEWKEAMDHGRITTDSKFKIRTKL